ncbi:MAG: 1-acyl-sn-glycerol-3-phosphate acyltransferase [Gloeomargarita sp. SKYBB_i_bin120]|nr:1-acyl-sn-glycerol-3-phosphate acyltransferase [Gloeomargarita sp. SKYG98]MCS7291505.1 1-acyl-sn-glycerol-3-phosphate acyltransferase [Gloeomargarita sp. SKYB120]MDW8177065.1 1-acyl-sn-glycerol-3-phosphate acyltransferase [Gloeomargarita sp. SKYBB_i_bin120]
MRRAQPGLRFIPPRYDPRVNRLIRCLLPLWLRFRLGITQVRVEGADILVPWYVQLQRREARVLLAFRHPTLDDPYAMLYLLERAVPQAAQERGVRLRLPLHSYFVYDRGIPLWAGRWVGWLFARLGGIPIQRGRSDRLALKTIREVLLRGDMPLTVAPEGGINNRSECLGPLEPGLAQLGFWCLEDLAKQGQTVPVVVIPIGIQYGFVRPPWQRINDLLTRLEEYCHLPVGSHASADPEALYARLLRLADYLLTQMETFYAQFYHHPPPALAEDLTVNDRLRLRLDHLRDVALRVTESFFGVTGKGTVIDRCRRLEAVAWEWMYRQDLAELSPVARWLADRIAQEVELRLWHMQLVEQLTSVTGDYIREKPSAERFAETLLILWSAVNHLRGRHQPVRLGQRWLSIRVGEPLCLNDYWETYSASRKAARQVVQEVTDRLAERLQGLIIS